jgi:hypothetical protein
MRRWSLQKWQFEEECMGLVHEDTLQFGRCFGDSRPSAIMICGKESQPMI